MLRQILVLQNRNSEYAWRSLALECFSQENSEEEIVCRRCGKGCLNRTGCSLKAGLWIQGWLRLIREVDPLSSWSGWVGPEAEPPRPASGLAMILIFPVCWTNVLIFCVSHDLKRERQYCLKGHSSASDMWWHDDRYSFPYQSGFLVADNGNLFWLI